MLELKTIESLRERLSLQEIRKVLKFLTERNHEPSFFVHNLVFVNTQLYLVEDLRDFGLTVLEASGQNKGQVVIHEVGAIGDIITEMRKDAERHHVLDFEKLAGLALAS